MYAGYMTPAYSLLRIATINVIAKHPTQLITDFVFDIRGIGARLWGEIAWIVHHRCNVLLWSISRVLSDYGRNRGQLTSQSTGHSGIHIHMSIVASRPKWNRVIRQIVHDLSELLA